MQYPYGCDLHVHDGTFYMVSCKCILDVYTSMANKCKCNFFVM